MKVSYYPGCSLQSTASEYGASTEAVLEALGITVKELPDWNCCGATSGHAVYPDLHQALSFRNLVIAEGEGLDLVVPCAACYNALRSTQEALAGGGPEARRLKEEMEDLLGRQYQGKVRVLHILEFLAREEVGELISARMRIPLSGLKLAAYYGCLLTRPPRTVSFETNPEQPRLMDTLLARLGSQPVSWSHKTECCGASLSIPAPEIVYNLVGKIIQAARRAGADAIVTACPLCQTNLDGRQPEGEKIPVFFLTELVGVALGLTPHAWLRKHLVDARPLLKARNLLTAAQA
ncbi:MAG: CoB--CoM heterodisulfide reductase iron-sulfur subunit B family protein [Thermoanaerobacteraceae bacterium]|uniref:CoB--CoM heterodisulfide reductase iron-sulfur subunit B family protein n=1 Tax=Thermanaeromonas sp. C210 TaxID=2731925 RepID=UPI00155CD07B|nr:CoB--CoM heterodisulfide reductase iron-sulfur subunit B family protein [Thermanaeromonas sp. C210]MBE3582195.1 CoB--CoM heterodisulfide reductase iron-sulfur subunit B family protein [Thermoanaerobacteraceae bacterium]GFN23607.1 disulfide reductase [Thermanaeromonas sp. C210]